jgi:hypothetical protein
MLRRKDEQLEMLKDDYGRLRGMYRMLDTRRRINVELLDDKISVPE